MVYDWLGSFCSNKRISFHVPSIRRICPPVYNFESFFFRGTRHVSPRVSSPPAGAGGCPSFWYVCGQTDQISNVACFLESVPICWVFEDDGTGICWLFRCLGEIYFRVSEKHVKKC